MKQDRRIWIVGASTGIGLELVKLCLESNYKVVVSSRNASTSQTLSKLEKMYKKNIRLVDLDVFLKDEIKPAVKKAWNSFDGLDIWFYNAGTYEVMDINTWSSDKFEIMNEVNYLGVVRIMTELLPYFKEQNTGHWVWNSSISSYFGLPQGGGYSAPKAALVNLAQSIKPELNIFNIKLQIINHGFVKTRLTDKNKFEMPQLMQPKYTAEKILKGMKNPNSFEIRFPFVLSLILRVLSLLPYKVSLGLTKRMLP